MGKKPPIKYSDYSDSRQLVADILERTTSSARTIQSLIRALDYGDVVRQVELMIQNEEIIEDESPCGLLEHEVKTRVNWIRSLIYRSLRNETELNLVGLDRDTFDNELLNNWSTLGFKPDLFLNILEKKTTREELQVFVNNCVDSGLIQWQWIIDMIISEDQDEKIDLPFMNKLAGSGIHGLGESRSRALGQYLFRLIHELDPNVFTDLVNRLKKVDPQIIQAVDSSVILEITEERWAELSKCRPEQISYVTPDVQKNGAVAMINRALPLV